MWQRIWQRTCPVLSSCAVTSKLSLTWTAWLHYQTYNRPWKVFVANKVKKTAAITSDKINERWVSSDGWSQLLNTILSCQTGIVVQQTNHNPILFLGFIHTIPNSFCTFNSCSDAISVTERSCTAPISKMARHILDTCSLTLYQKAFALPIAVVTRKQTEAALCRSLKQRVKYRIGRFILNYIG